MSLLNTTIYRDLEPGIYNAFIVSYKECKPEGKQPYVSIDLSVDNMIITDRWYSARIPYLMRCLRKQFHKDYFDVTLSELLNYAMTHDFTVTVSYDIRYGLQIEYKEAV